MCIDMNEMNMALVGASDTAREADASLCGYFYQVDQTLVRILKNKNTEKVLLIEVLEDILEYGIEKVEINGTIVKKQVITAYQIKHHNNNVSNSTAYKPILLGFISYQRVKNEFNKIKAKIDDDYIYKYKIVYGLPAGKNITVNTREAWDSIIQYAPFNSNYKNLASIWKANMIENESLSNYSIDDINEYLLCTELVKNRELKDYSDEVVEEIRYKIDGINGLEDIPAKDLYYVMWSIVKELMLENSTHKQEITFDVLIEKTRDIVKFGHAYDQYEKVYYLEKIKSLIHNAVANTLSEIYEENIEDNEVIYNQYCNCYAGIVEQFILKQFENVNYRYSFFNTLVPEGTLMKVDNAADEYESFMLNNGYITSFIRILLKMVYCQNINSIEKLEDIFVITESMWSIKGLDERGKAVLIAFREDMTDNKVGHIAKKMNEANEFPDVWYMKNNDDYCCNSLYDYKIDIAKPKINYSNLYQTGKPSKVFTIECMKCLKMRNFTDVTGCDILHRGGCINE
ncbi:hypothetical protein [uncultured Clostridium sp.]|uniref:hypothetical protein n=1 Tax=uncultured Clostridium sp. TaxID=59620 RepID=UPI0032170BCF